MNKKQRLMFGVSIIVVLLGYQLFFSGGLVSKQYEVSQAVEAKQELDGKVIPVNGSLVKGTDQWDSLNRTLKFKMTDGINTIDVIYKGDKPNIPDEYQDIDVVVTGKFNGNVFEAFNMLTKCPSKYEATSDQLMKEGT